ncbi:hypothetical protein Vretimale_5977 [Volvox reticuliferus]|nr:hypothetical protein Vretimale_5977 [Volvox reticuliferus]
MINSSFNFNFSSRRNLYLFWTLVVACLLLTTSNCSKPRPWCLDGSVLCRGLTAPTERFGHTITLLPANQMETRQVQAITIGGQRSQYATSVLPLSMLEIINLEDMTLRNQEAAFSLPANVSLRTRSGHAAVPYRDTQLLVFGGLTYNREEALTAVATNDLLLLDWGSARNGEAMPTWRSLYNRTAGGGGSDPVPRYRAAVAMTGELLWVFGGLDNFTHILSDTLRYNITRGRWRTMITNITGSVVPCDSNGVPGLQRATMAASPSGRFVLLYGGRNESDFPQKGLWLLDTSSMGPNNTIKWIQLGLEFPGGEDLNLPGYDSTMTFVRTDNGGQELLIASLGAWKTSAKARPTSWRQWVNVIKSDTAGQLETLLERIAATGSTASAALPFVRRRLFISSVAGLPILLPDNTNLPGPYVEQVPFPSYLLWVRDAALALTADGTQLFITGGADTAKASSKFFILSLERGTVIDADSSLRPDYVQSSLSSFLFRHAIHVTVPYNLSAWRPDDPRVMTDLLFYTGLDNVNADGDPKFTEIRMLDATDHRIVGSCSASNVKASAGSCKVLPLPRPGTSVTDLPSPRDGAALAPLHQVFHWQNTTFSTDIGTVIVLMYGGMSLVGDVLNSTGSSAGDAELLSSGEAQVRSALEVCENLSAGRVILASQYGSAAQDLQPQLDEVAKCTYTHLKQTVPEGLCPGSGGGDNARTSGYAYDYDVQDYGALGGDSNGKGGNLGG